MLFGVRGRVRALGWRDMSRREESGNTLPQSKSGGHWVKSGDTSPHSKKQSKKTKSPFRFCRKGLKGSNLS